MNFLHGIVPENLIEAFGWMIVHSLWQGALVALLLSIVLLLMNKRTARVRYIASVGALLLFSAMSIRTFVDHYDISKERVVVGLSSQEIHSTAAATTNVATNNSITNNTLFTEFSNYFYEHFPLIVTIYLLGVLFLTLKLTGGYLYSQRIKNYRTKTADEKFRNIVSEFSQRLNIKQSVKLVESALVKVPVTLGYIKPVILFPLGMLTGMSYEQVETIIAHELAHIKRADYLVNLLQSILEVIFFYHPAVWWISSIIREERENVCDDLALEISSQPADLAKALVYVSQFENGKSSLAMSAIGNKNKLKRRVKRMMGENKHKTFRSRVYSASLILLVVLSFGAIACSTANSDVYPQDRHNLVYEEDWDGDRRYIDTDLIYDDEERTYIFYERYRGEKSKWEVTVDDDRIVDLYKDGDRVPNDEIYKYEDHLLDEIEDIDWEMRELHENLADLKYDLQDLKVDLGEDFADEMRTLAADLRHEFDSDEFRESMQELKRELKNMKYDFDFDFDFDWDRGDFAFNMRELQRELSNIKVSVDLDGLDESMRELREDMRDLDIDMSELKKEMKVLKEFLHDLKYELVEDGLIDDADDLEDLEFEDDAMYVNDRKVPHDLYLKYKEMYRDYFGEYPDDNSFRMKR